MSLINSPKCNEATNFKNIFEWNMILSFYLKTFSISGFLTVRHTSFFNFILLGKLLKTYVTGLQHNWGLGCKVMKGYIGGREVNKNNLLGGQFLIFLPKNPGK